MCEGQAPGAIAGNARQDPRNVGREEECLTWLE